MASQYVERDREGWHEKTGAEAPCCCQREDSAPVRFWRLLSVYLVAGSGWRHGVPKARARSQPTTIKPMVSTAVPMTSIW